MDKETQFMSTSFVGFPVSPFSLLDKLIAKSESPECQRSHCFGFREQLQQTFVQSP
jgi:hypothetical protein